MRTHLITQSPDVVGLHTKREAGNRSASVIETVMMHATPDEFMAAMLVFGWRPVLFAAPLSMMQLMTVARAVRAKCESMTGNELEDWWRGHMGDDKHSANPVLLTAAVASAMFVQVVQLSGAGNDAEDIDTAALLLERGITDPPQPRGDFEENLLEDARQRGWVL